MNTLNLKKFIDLIKIYNGWSEFVQVGNCSKEFEKTLLNEAYKRTSWAFFSASNLLSGKDYKIFVNYLDKNRHLIDNALREISVFYRLCFYISRKNPYFGYGFFKIGTIIRKGVSKIYSKLNWRLKWQ